VTGNLALDQVQLLSGTDCTFAIDDHLAFTFHGQQAALKETQFGILDRQHGGQFFREHWHTVIFQKLQNELPAG
jgi:hypothetical protein